jgi:chemotaxis-related protein WspD
MTTPDIAVAGRPNTDDCWNHIGIAGDRSCPELTSHIHCRNCPVFSAAAKGFFDRPAPSGYLAEWTRLLAAPVIAEERDHISVLIFRLGPEWLALRTRAIVEVTTARQVHRIPHRSNQILTGMVNLRGQLQLIFSMHGLIGVETTGDTQERTANPARGDGYRLVVMRSDGYTWVFNADEVAGVERFARSKIQAVPSNLANPANSFSQAVIPWHDHSVGFLDEQRVHASLMGIGQ